MRVFEQLRQDAAYALRTLRQSPGFTAIAGITLILGIGATTAIFSVVNAVLLRSLPYRDPDRLVHILGDDPRDSRSGVSWRAFEVWRSEEGAFSALAAYYRNTGWSRVTIGGTEDPQSVQAGFTTASFFDLLGVSPVVGRIFEASEVQNRATVAVLSSALWQRRFGGELSAIGRTIDVDGRAFTVIGVMPPEFRFPSRETELWLPISANRFWNERPLPDNVHTRGYYMRWNVLGRLRKGVGTPAAAQFLERFNGRLAAEDPDWNMGLRVKVVPVTIEMNANARLGLFVLFGSVCIVLLIGCANVANLTLARGAARARELSVRAALGATRRRIVRQVLTESLVLVGLSGCGAILIAQAALRVLVRYGPPDLPRLEEASIDVGVLCFTLFVSAFAALFFGIVPALRAGGADPNEYLGTAGRTFTPGKSTARFGAALIVAEFAFAMVLLAAAGLLIRSLHAVESVRLGFSIEHVLTTQIRPPDGTTAARSAAFEDQMLARLRSLPGVVHAGGISSLFELGRPPDNSLRMVEGQAPHPRDTGALTWTTVSGDYFQAMGITLLAGRYFSDHDTSSAPLVAVIDEAMARRYWRNENPIGKRFKGQDARGANDDWLTVIGVVRNARRQGLEQEPTPHVYEWHKQAGPVRVWVVRTLTEPSALANSIRTIARDVEPRAIVSGVMTMRHQLDAQTAARRFQTWLLGLFAGLALLLATVGVYGVISYATARRTHEMGIRRALGAPGSRILAMVLREGMALAVCGLGLGLAAAVSFTHLLSGLLFGVTPTDPLTLVTVGLVLLGVGASATLVPAWRATQVDPALILRSQ